MIFCSADVSKDALLKKSNAHQDMILFRNHIYSLVPIDTSFYTNNFIFVFVGKQIFENARILR